MGFDSPFFAPFFIAVFLLFWFVPMGRAARSWLLAAASFAFYAAGEGTALLLLVALAAATYGTGPLIARWRGSLAGSFCLGAALVCDLAAFSLAWREPAALMPVGISFFALQCASYSVDIHRSEWELPSPGEFLAALFFFPKLIAGPLVRWPDWLPQLRDPGRLEWGQVRRAFLLLAVGYAKKRAAELLALTAAAAFENPGSLSMRAAWAGALASAGQIYGAFSGYSDIAVGLGLLLGFSLPSNFDRPYFAASPMEFWRRWHTSMYAWLYEYIYLPLALTARWAPFLALMATAALGGLWHGARGTFLAYGVYNGLILAAAYWLSRRLGPRRRFSWPWRLAATAATFYLVVIGLVFARSEDMPMAFQFLAAMHRPSSLSADVYSALALALAVAMLAFCHGLDSGARWLLARPRSPWLWPAVAAGLTFSMAVGYGATPLFTYFQF